MNSAPEQEFIFCQPQGSLFSYLCTVDDVTGS